jgi:hypothetical protein
MFVHVVKGVDFAHGLGVSCWRGCNALSARCLGHVAPQVIARVAAFLQKSDQSAFGAGQPAGLARQAQGGAPTAARSARRLVAP